MVSTIGTAESPLQLCNDMYSRLAILQDLLKKRLQTRNPSEIASTDEKAINAIETLSSQMDKFNSALFRGILQDAQRIASLAKKYPQSSRDIKIVLRRIEDLFKLTKRAHREHLIREARFFIPYTHRLANLTKQLMRGVEQAEMTFNVNQKRKAEEARRTVNINQSKQRRKEEELRRKANTIKFPSNKRPQLKRAA